MNMLPRQDEGGPNRAQRSWRGRLRLLQMGIIAVFCVVGLRLIQIQIVEAEKYKKLAYYTRVHPLPAIRGSLYDRNEKILASISMNVSVAVDPKHVGKESTAIAKTMSRITGKSVSFYRSVMRKKSRNEYLARRLPPKVVAEFGLDTLKSLQLRDEPMRIYHTDVAGQLIGTTSTDNTGIAGLELQYETVLSGVDGSVMYALDGRQNERASVDYPREEPVPGHSLVLTIDLWLQQLAERELEKGIAESEAEGGIVVMMDPRTGEILTMAQYPRVNPATFGKSPTVHQKLRAVTDMFEPGSVFKIVTASAAMEYNLIPPEQEFDAENGVFKVPIGRGKRYRTHRDVHKYGILTFREAIEFSSNIVMVKASDIIGNEKLYLTARDYGFGMPTDIDMPGEIGGLMRKPSEWSGLSRHSFSYGYEVGVTPIQIAAAYAAVANGGTLMKPFIVKRELDAGGSVVRETEPQKIRRVVSEETAAELSSFLEGVVERGTASSARIEGLRIAGKTGTSKRVVGGSYKGKDYTASFVGYFPAEDPRLLCLVMLDNPRGINYYGGTTSAPIFHSIVQRIITTSDRYGQAAPLPRAETISSPARSTMKPTARTSSKNTRRTGSALPAKNPGHVVPDVRGYSLRKAIGILLDEKFKTKVHGSGMVVSQSPGPGEPVKTGMVVTLTCQPKSVDFDGMQ